MSRSVLLMIVAAVMLATACSDPAADKTKAVTGEATQVASPSAAAHGQKYLITPQNSKVEFTGSKVTGSHNGSFGDFSGQIDYAGTPEQSHVNIVMKADSLTTDTPDLTKHLKTADFFDVAKFPEATFVSTSIKAGGEQGASHTVTGNLTLHGVTKAVTFPATITVTPDVASVDSTFSINRKDFGINYAGQADNLIRDNVVLKLTIRAAKAG
ncbi:MAG TPA: YceI family protein [Pyrinomonadaceae bacterium]|jgi:polyisoprenoid-binding protein YceI|nr:YceI family protein [Pyrinomonadaceae bacterium]